MAVRIEGVLATNVAPETGDILIAVRGDDGKTYTLRFARGMVPLLAVTLAMQLRKSAPQFDTAPNYQSATLTGARMYLNEDGKAGLELQLDGGLPLGLLIPPTAIPALQNALRELGILQIQPDSSTSKH